jgi:hypothetical protein
METQVLWVKVLDMLDATSAHHSFQSALCIVGISMSILLYICGLLGGIKLDFIQVLLFLLSGMTFWYPKLCPIREYKKNLETNTLDCHLMLKAFWKLNDDYSKLLASCSLSSGKLYFEQRQAITMIQPRQNKIKKATSFYRSQSNQDTKELRYYNPSFVSFNPALDCGQRLLRPAKKLVIQTLEVIMGNGFVAMSATYSIIVAC